jgi:hypothetical protein
MIIENKEVFGVYIICQDCSIIKMGNLKFVKGLDDEVETLSIINTINGVETVVYRKLLGVAIGVDIFEICKSDLTNRIISYLDGRYTIIDFRWF